MEMLGNPVLNWPVPWLQWHQNGGGTFALEVSLGERRVSCLTQGDCSWHQWVSTVLNLCMNGPRVEKAHVGCPVGRGSGFGSICLFCPPPRPSPSFLPPSTTPLPLPEYSYPRVMLQSVFLQACNPVSQQNAMTAAAKGFWNGPLIQICKSDPANCG